MTTPAYSWWNDDSELTEPSESETSSGEDPPPVVVPVNQVRPTRPSTQQATKQSRDRIVAKSSPYLKSPRTTTYSLSSLHEMMTSGTINLDPEYQRAVVWTTTKQESLIDSFYHNFYVPPIIFATTREEDGTEIRTCIDGKQRLTSMRLFMDGELPHKDSMRGIRSWFSNPKGSKRRLITPQWQIKFKNTQIACVEYDDITEEQQREIFQRVQMGVTLTPADRLQSVNGPIADLVREVRVRINSTEGFEGYLDWGKTRGKDFKALAEIAYLITHAKTARSEPTVQRLEAFLDNKTHPLSAAKRREEFLAILQPAMTNAMDIFCRIVQHPELGEPLRKNLSPIEFVMSAYLVFLYRKRLSDTQLSHAIANMRRDAKHSFNDMKFDTAKCKYLLSFIHKTIPRLIPGLNTDNCRDIPAIQVPSQRVECRFGDRYKDAKVEDTSAKPATKRRHVEPEDEKNHSDDSDDEPLQTRKHKVKRKRSSSTPDLDSRKKAVDIGPPPKPRTQPSRPSLNTGRSSAPVSKAKTTIKRMPAKHQTTSSQVIMSDFTQVSSNKSEYLQVATPTVKTPPSTKTVSGPSQQVISKLGAHMFEPVPLGRRARAAMNQPSPTAPVIPMAETQTAPTSSILRGPPFPGRYRNMSFTSNSPVVQQRTLPSLTSSTSGTVLPPDGPTTLQTAGNTSNNSARIRAGTVGLDRLAAVRSTKAAASNRSASVVSYSPNSGFPQVPHPSPTIPASTLEASSTTVDDTDARWQNAFAGLLPTPTHSRTTQASRMESTAVGSSRALAPVDHSISTTSDVRMHDSSESVDG